MQEGTILQALLLKRKKKMFKFKDLALEDELVLFTDRL